MRIFLVRHGETNLNARKQFQGSLDEPLNEKGIKQAKAIAKRLSKEKIDAIYSSAMIRACHTADEIAKEHRLKVSRRPELNEVAYGEWEGKTIADIEKMDPELIARRKIDIAYRYVTRPPKGESYADLEKRVKPFVEDLLAKKYKSVVIVTHGAVTRMLIKVLMQLNVENIPRDFMHNTSLSILEKKDDKFGMVLFNCDKHLCEIEKLS